MKALGIAAGPRKQQITDCLTDAVLAGFKKEGAETDKIYLYDMKIAPCKGCGSCAKTGECIIKDDHAGVIEKLKNADAVVFASPTYVGNVTSEAKKFFDRSVCYFTMGLLGPRWTFDKPKYAVLITACGAPYPFSHLLGYASGAIRAMKIFFGFMGTKITIVASTGQGNYDDKKCAGIVSKAERTGQNIGKKIKKQGGKHGECGQCNES